MGRVHSEDEAARCALAPGNRRWAAGIPDATNARGIEGRTVRSRLGRSSAEVARRGALEDSVGDRTPGGTFEHCTERGSVSESKIVTIVAEIT